MFPLVYELSPIHIAATELRVGDVAQEKFSVIYVAFKDHSSHREQYVHLYFTEGAATVRKNNASIDYVVYSLTLLMSVILL